MHVMKLLSIFFAALLIFPAYAAETKNPAASAETPPPFVESQEKHSASEAVKRPQREVVKVSPTVRTSPPRPNESGKMRRTAPARTAAPLQHVPTLKGLYPPSSTDTVPDVLPRQSSETPAR